MDIEAFKEQIWQFILARGVPYADAEDIFQDTWLALWQTVPGHPNPIALAFQIARNKVVDFWRERKPHTSLEDMVTSDLPADSSTSMESIQNQLQTLYQRAGLKEEQVTLVTLHHILGYSTRECSDIIELSEETVRSRLKVARKHLRKRANLDTFIGGMR